MLFRPNAEYEWSDERTVAFDVETCFESNTDTLSVQCPCLNDTCPSFSFLLLRRERDPLANLYESEIEALNRAKHGASRSVREVAKDYDVMLVPVMRFTNLLIT